MQQKEAGQTSQPPPETINLEETPQDTAPPSQQVQQEAPDTSAPTTSAPTIEQAENLDMQKLRKEIQVLESQMSELSQAQDSLAKINEKYDKSKQNVVEREREVKALKKRIDELEKELTLDKVTTELKRVIWTTIGQSITNQWEYIEAIYEQVALIGRARKEIHRARVSLSSMPEIATKMIDVLNYRTSS